MTHEHIETSTARRLTLASAIAMIAFAVAACGGSPGDQDQAQAASRPQGTMASAEQEHAEMFRNVDRAVAVLRPTEGNDVRGQIAFIETPDGVQVKATVTGLEPGSTRGIHIHKYGDVTAADGTAAGGHYNPEHHDHALPDQSPRHAGDLGNLQADAEGTASLDIMVDNITVAGLKNPVLGRAVIVHARPDDGSQPTGAAGARLAQGVIGVAGPQGSQQ